MDKHYPGFFVLLGLGTTDYNSSTIIGFGAYILSGSLKYI